MARHVIPKRPQSVAAAVVLLWLSLVPGIASGILAIIHGYFAEMYSEADLYFILAIKAAVNALIYVKIWEGRNWARLLLFVAFAVGLLPALYIATSVYEGSGALVALLAARMLFVLCALYLVWTRVANNWFRTLATPTGTVVPVVIWLIAGSQVPASRTVVAQTINASTDVPVALDFEGRWLVYPHLAANPIHREHVLLGAVLTDPSGEASRRNCVVAVSFDRGATWESHEFPITDCGDPWVAITFEGEAVFTALGRDPGLPQQDRTGLVLYHSSNGGRSWNGPVGLGNGHDRQTIVVARRT